MISFDSDTDPDSFHTNDIPKDISPFRIDKIGLHFINILSYQINNYNLMFLIYFEYLDFEKETLIIS